MIMNVIEMFLICSFINILGVVLMILGCAIMHITQELNYHVYACFFGSNVIFFGTSIIMMDFWFFFQTLALCFCNILGVCVKIRQHFKQLRLDDSRKKYELDIKSIYPSNEHYIFPLNHEFVKHFFNMQYGKFAERDLGLNLKSLAKKYLDGDEIHV